MVCHCGSSYKGLRDTGRRHCVSHPLEEPLEQDGISKSLVQTSDTMQKVPKTCREPFWAQPAALMSWPHFLTACRLKTVLQFENNMTALRTQPQQNHRTPLLKQTPYGNSKYAISNLPCAAALCAAPTHQQRPEGVAGWPWGQCRR